MTLPKRTRQLLTLLLIACSLWLFFRESTKEPLTRTSQIDTRERPSAFTNGATILNYSEDSQVPTYSISSVESLYFSQQGKLESIAPEITLRDERGRAYLLTARKGTFLEQNRLLSLDGEVRLQQLTPEAGTAPTGPTSALQEESPAQTKPDAFELQTEQLQVDIDKRFIYTEQAVKIIYNDQTLNAVGLNASLENKTLELLDQVRGRYELH